MTTPSPDDGVMTNLIAAGMNAAIYAAAASQPEPPYGLVLEQITLTLLGTYEPRAVIRELCSTAGWVLMVRGENVRIGELVCRRTEGVWTFEIDPSARSRDIADDLRKAAQLVCVYANLQQQLTEDWGTTNPYWETPPGVSADKAAWEQLLAATHAESIVPTCKALFVLAGVLVKWAGEQSVARGQSAREATARLMDDLASGWADEVSPE